MLNLMETDANVNLLSELLESVSNDKLFNFFTNAFVYQSDIRLSLLESIGRNLLKFSFVPDLYENSSSLGKSGIIYASGFMSEDNVLGWLESFLYNNEYEVSSSAVFALSRHNTKGFRVLVDNFNKLNNRLKIVTIDLLIFNRFEPLYQEFPNMLKVEDKVIADRVIVALENLGDNNTEYIIECLRVALPKYSLRLLEILDKKSDKSYLSKIYFLLYDNNLRDSIIELFYTNSSEFLIQRAVTLETKDIANSIILYGFRNNSPVIFRNRVFESISLRYFLANLSITEVADYFEAINFDSQYIEDYKNLDEIYKALVYIDNFEESNGEVDFITKYFDINQKEFVTEQDNDAFFSGMESWLESGDISSLNRSMEIKKAGRGNNSSLENEKTDFIESLDTENQERIKKYENYKQDIISYYRTTSFRLKFFAEELINDYGFTYLIE